MLNMIVRRILSIVPTVLLASFAVFLLLQLVPGDPAVTVLGEQATPEQVAQIHEDLGLDDPLLVQYRDWLGNAITGDLGESVKSREPVTDALRRTLPVTLHVVVGGLLIALLVGVPLGLFAAARAGSRLDRFVTGASSLGVAIPSFWLGLILVTALAVQRRLLPATGFVSITDDVGESIRHLILPAITLGVVGAAEVMRQLRAAMIEVFRSDFVRTHRAMGIAHWRIAWRFGLKNAGVPLLTVLGLQINRFLGATVLVEAVYGIRGMGQLVVLSTTQKDLVVVQGVLLVTALIVAITNLVVDVSYRVVDPRIR